MTEQELNAALDLTKKIDRLTGQLDDLRQTGGVGAMEVTEIAKGGCGAVSAGQIAAEIEDEITDLCRQREIEQVVIGRYIDKQGLGELERKVLRLRYVECRPWVQVALVVGYTRRHTLRLHADIIKKLSPSVT